AARGHWTKWSITWSFELRLAHRQRLRIRDNKWNLLGSSSEVGSSIAEVAPKRMMETSELDPSFVFNRYLNRI
ncbi:hypothetical protein LINGRAHAP2_LOCUS30361, partial [Linum grandiflorum]